MSFPSNRLFRISSLTKLANLLSHTFALECVTTATNRFATQKGDCCKKVIAFFIAISNETESVCTLQAIFGKFSNNCLVNVFFSPIYTFFDRIAFHPLFNSVRKLRFDPLKMSGFIRFFPKS